MQYRPLGHSGIQASAVGLGTWAIGGWMWGGSDEADAVRAIHAAVDAGVNLIDTAPVYGFGTSEEVVGKAIKDRRDRVVLATKCGLVWDQAKSGKGELFFHSDEQHPTEDAANAKYEVRRFLGADSIREEVEHSLRRLGVDCIDLYQTHWQEPTTPIEETMKALVKLKEQGKIRTIGVSNAGPDQMAEYAKFGAVASDQEKFSMLDRGIEDDQLPYCRANGIAVLAYSPLAQGLLTGKVTADREFGEGDQRRDKPRFSRENREKVNRMLEDIRPIAEAREMSLAQLTIAWTIAREGLTHALVGARDERQAMENAAAGDVELTGDELKRIDDAIERYAADVP